MEIAGSGTPAGGTESRFLRQGSQTSCATSFAAENVALEYAGDTESEPVPQVLTSEFAASVNLTKNLVGSGIFTLPLALSKASVLPGVLMMLFIGVLCGGSFVLIAYLCRTLKVSTYRDLGAKSFGPLTALLIDLSIFLNAMFACLAYVILVLDFFEKSLPPLTGLEIPRWQILIVDTLVFILPLSLIKDLSPLRVPSMIGLLIIAYIFFYVLGDWVFQLDESISNFQSCFFEFRLGIFFSASVFTGAFKAHYNSPTFYRELGENLGAHARVVRNSYVSAFVLYSCFAIAGYGIFGSGVEGNILKNYGSGEGGPSVPILVALLGMAFAITLTYPLVFNSGRGALYGLVPPLEKAKNANPQMVHFLLTAAMVVTISAAGCVVTDVQIVLGLTGATIGMALCFILPAVAFLKVALSDTATVTIMHAKPLIAFSFLLLGFGLMSVVIGTLVVMGVVA